MSRTARRLWMPVALLVALAAGCTHRLQFRPDEPRMAAPALPLVRPVDIALSTSGHAPPRLTRAFWRELRCRDDLHLARDPHAAAYELELRVKTSADACWLNLPLSWPGFLIFAPAWHGLAWHYRVTTLVAITRADGVRTAEVWEKEAFDVRYTSNPYGVGAGLGWLPITLTIPALASGTVAALLPPDHHLLDEEFGLREGETWAANVVSRTVDAIAADTAAPSSATTPLGPGGGR